MKEQITKASALVSLCEVKRRSSCCHIVGQFINQPEFPIEAQYFLHTSATYLLYLNNILQLDIYVTYDYIASDHSLLRYLACAFETPPVSLTALLPSSAFMGPSLKQSRSLLSKVKTLICVYLHN